MNNSFSETFRDIKYIFVIVSLEVKTVLSDMYVTGELQSGG